MYIHNIFRITFIAVSIAFIGGCGKNHTDQNEAVEELRLGRYVFHVPEDNAVTKEIPVWLKLIPGMDDGSRSALIRFKGNEIKKSILSYSVENNQFHDDIEALLMVLTPEEKQRYHSPQYSQLESLWYSNGSYKKRRVELNKDYGWYRVYREIEYPKSWAYLNQYPDANITVPKEPLDFWVAHCLLLGPVGAKSISCKSFVMIDDIVIEFSISDYNLPVIEEIRGFLKSTIVGWIVETDN